MRRVAELLGVHFAQTLETRDLHALLAAAADGGQQAAKIFQPDRVLAAAEHVTRLLHARPLLRNQAVDLEAHLPQLGQLAVDGTDLVELDDVQAAGGMPVAFRLPVTFGVTAAVGRGGGSGAASSLSFNSLPDSCSCCSMNSSSVLREANQCSPCPMKT